MRPSIPPEPQDRVIGPKDALQLADVHPSAASVVIPHV